MLSIRNARPSDAGLVLDFIRRLAEYEGAPNTVVATEADLIRDGFGSDPKYRCLIAEWDNQPAGFALFLHNYSTWRGRPGFYLEDLFVYPEMRGKGVGKALLRRLAEIARLTNLRELYLNHTRFTDKGLAALKPLQNLERIEMFRTRTGDAGVAALSELKNLAVVKLDYTTVDPKVFAAFQAILPRPMRPALFKIAACRIC